MTDIRAVAFISLSVALVGVSDARSEADQSPPPGGVYRLKPGVYVADGSSCQEPPNFAIRRYDGKGISTAHTSDCNAHVVSKRRIGDEHVYKIDQSCQDTGDESGKRFTERQTISVPDVLTFTITSESDTIYTYCPINNLPNWLR